MTDISKKNGNGIWGPACVGHMYMDNYRYYNENIEVP